jgi:TonB-linked SusC/RagA family outer membrane protein
MKKVQDYFIRKRSGITFGLFFSLICFLLMPIAGNLYGSNHTLTTFQTKKITGTVIDASTGEALPGVNITVEGTTIGVISDMSGKYSIEVYSPDAVLVFSYVGYLTEKGSVQGVSSMDMKLSPDIKSLEEVVVVGYGTQRKSDLTGAVTSIKANEITNIGGSNIAQALQGKTPGVEIKNVGEPGADPLVFVRGLGTNGDAKPLYVVDGMMVSSIGFLTSGDIASMEILKDASATAIYGSRGANGVILITTKKGQKGKPVINFSASSGFQFLTNRYEKCDAKEYAQLVNLFMTNKGSAAIYNPDTISGGTDWLDEVIQKGITSDYQLSVAGGNENMNYNISASYFKQEGILKYTSYDRLTLRANNEYKIVKRISVGHNLSFASSNTNGDAQWNGGRGINSIYRISPLLTVRKADGSFTPGQDVDIVNPYAALYYNKEVQSHPIQFVGNGWLNYEIIDGLTFRSSFGIDYTYNHTTAFWPKYNLGSNQSNGSNSVRDGNTYNYSWLWENTLTYDKQLGANHHINLLAGYTAQNTDYSLLDLAGSSLYSTDENFRYIQAVPITNVSYNSTTKPYSESILSYLVRANYVFKDRYLLTASLRMDGSSKFDKNDRWGQFPSVALGWRASQEEFLKNISWISNLKFRASWGQIGSNKISNYQIYNMLVTAPEYDATFNGTTYTNATSTAANNPDITWEVSEQTDLGFEFGSLKNRLKFEFDYYNRETKNLLVTLPIQGGSAGFSAAASNSGTVRNRGVEFVVSWDDKSGEFSYGARFSGSINKNKVTELGVDTKGFGDWMLPSNHMFAKGYSIGEFYGYKVAGIAQDQAQIDALNANAVAMSGLAGKQYWANLKPGDLIFQDINGDGYVDVNDKTSIGSPHPDFIGGLTLNAAYKGFDFAIDLMGSFGAKIYNVERNQFVSSGLSNLNKEWLNSWTPTNTNASMPRYATGTSVGEISDFNISDGSYVKARYIELGYTFNKNVLGKIKISSLRLYVNASNPFYITKYKGFSPEVSNSYGVTTMGDDFRTYPVAGILKAGVNVVF